MFERFTAEARAVVSGAAEQADRTGSDTIGEPELLLALLDRTDSPAAGALAALGVPDRRASVTDALAAVRRRGGVSAADAAALADLGIDVDAIVASVEREHGVGALAGGTSGRRRGCAAGSPPRRSPSWSAPCGWRSPAATGPSVTSICCSR